MINGLTTLFLGLNKQFSIITAAGLHPAFRCCYDQKSNYKNTFLLKRAASSVFSESFLIPLLTKQFISTDSMAVLIQLQEGRLDPSLSHHDGGMTGM